MRGCLIARLALILAPVVSIAAAPADAPSVLVTTTALRAGSLPRIVRAYGSVQADPSARDTIAAPLAATVGALHVRAGEAIAKGAVLLVLVPTPQTSAAYAQAVSAREAAVATVARTRALLGEQLATRQQLADAQKVRADAQSALAALQAQGAAGPTPLRSPFNAIVTAVNTSVRAVVTEGTPLLDLTAPEGLVLQVEVVPDQVAAIVAGDAVAITPTFGSGSFRGKVVFRGSVVAADGLVPVQISLPPGALFPGQTAAAAITTGLAAGYVVPHQAVLVDDAGGYYVVQLVSMAAKIVRVHLTAAYGDRDLIDGPLDVSAPLILAGNYQLQDGMKVRLANPADPRSR